MPSMIRCPFVLLIGLLTPLAFTMPGQADSVRFAEPPKEVLPGEAVTLPMTYHVKAGSKATQLIVIFQQPEHGVKQTVYRQASASEKAKTVNVPLTVPRSAKPGKGQFYAVLSGPGWSPVKQSWSNVTVGGGTTAAPGSDAVKIASMPKGLLVPGKTYPVSASYTIDPKSSSNHAVLVFEQSQHNIKTTVFGKTQKGQPGTVTFDLAVPDNAKQGEASLYIALNGKGWNPTAEAKAKLKVASPEPLIDRYGQWINADWPSKIKSDGDLQARWEEEKKKLAEWGRPTEFDKFGGWKNAGWTEEATGFYRVAQRNGYYWLISPEGNPMFYTGPCAAPGLNWPKTPVTEREWLFEELPAKDGRFAAAWDHDVWGWGDKADYVSFQTVNMIKKYGDENWRQIATALTEQRIRTMGFSGIGKWGGLFGDGARLAMVEGLGCFGYAHTHGKAIPKIGGKPDVFDPEVVQKIVNQLDGQVSKHRDNPYIVGWGVNNETDWVKAGVVPGFLKRGADTPGKRALVDEALTYYDNDVAKLAAAWNAKGTTVEELYAEELRAPAKDAEKLRIFFSHRYFAKIYEIMKDLAPNHLYFGYWIVPWWWEGPQDWDVLAPYVDVIGYDHYNFRHDGGIRDLIENHDKPILLGEFSISPTYNNERGYREYKKVGAPTDAAAGEKYIELIKHAAEDPKCIGALWFLYRDQPITGRGPGKGARVRIGEHHAMGLIDMADTPKWGLVERVREANLNASRWRLEASQRGD